MSDESDSEWVPAPPRASLQAQQQLLATAVSPTERSPLLPDNCDTTNNTTNLLAAGNNSKWRRTVALAQARARYYIPSLSWVPAYHRADWVHDALAGATVASVLIPQGLSYASTLAKLDPIVGLYTAAFPALIYAFLGTSRQMSVGPEALASILVGEAVSRNADWTLAPELAAAHRLQISGTLCLLVGLFTFLLGFFRFGFIDSVLSRPLLRGFITAVAIVIMVEQAPTLLGLHALPRADNPLLIGLATHQRYHNDTASSGGPGTGTGTGSPAEFEDPSPLDKFIAVIRDLRFTHIATCCVSVLAIVFIFATRWLKARLSPRLPSLVLLPEILLLVVVSISASWAVDLADVYHVPILGAIQVPSGFLPFPAPAIPSLLPFSTVRALIIPAFLISILGFVESIVVVKQYAAAHNYPVSRNRELVALGVSNLVGAVMGAFPAFGSMSRSRISDRAGARTQLAGLVAGGLVMLAILVMLPLFQHLPKAVMAAIILVAAGSLIEAEEIVFLMRLRAFSDIGAMLFTFVITLTVSIEAGILLSMALSLMLVVKDVAVPKLTLLGRTPAPAMDSLVSRNGGADSLHGGLTELGAYRPLDRLRHVANGGAGPASPSNGSFFGVESDMDPFDYMSPTRAPEGADPASRTPSLRPSESQVSLSRHSTMITMGGGGVSGSVLGGATPAATPIPAAPAAAHHLTEFLSPDSVVVVRIDEPLHFANTGDLRERLLRAEQFGCMRAHPADPPRRRAPLRRVVLDVRHMSRIDASAALCLHDIVRDYHARGVGVAFVRVHPSVRLVLERAGIADHILFADRVAHVVGHGPADEPTTPHAPGRPATLDYPRSSSIRGSAAVAPRPDSPQYMTISDPPVPPSPIRQVPPPTSHLLYDSPAGGGGALPPHGAYSSPRDRGHRRSGSSVHGAYGGSPATTVPGVSLVEPGFRALSADRPAPLLRGAFVPHGSFGTNDALHSPTTTDGDDIV
ncbi:sulfate transporter family-domain-containing protein [Blastocladiella britannica]|nr:sulfate transporter family-domain-containing protein [Blastocladiella britannica]